MKDLAIQSCVAMGCITILVTVALLKGIDGILLAGSVATIAGLGGFVVGGILKKK